MVASTKGGCEFLKSKELEIVEINEESPRREDGKGEEECSGKCCGCKMVEVASSAAVLKGSNSFACFVKKEISYLFVQV